MAIKIFRNLRSLLPIPSKWDDEGKSFALKIEDAYKWLQTQMSNDRDNTEASKAKKIQLTDDDDTWAKVWAKLDTLSNNECAILSVTAVSMNVITQGSGGSVCGGFITRRDSSTFDILLRVTRLTINNIYLVSASSSGFTYANAIFNPTYNNLNQASSGYALDARQGKALNDKKVEKIVLGSNDDTWAKIWTKISALSSGDTAGFYANGVAYSVLSGGARSSQCMGIIARYSSGAFQLLLRFSNVYGLYASITDASSSTRGTYAEGILGSTYNALDRTGSGYALDARQGKILNDKIRDDTIVYQASATTHTFTVSNNSRNLVIFGGDGASYTYIGYVYGASGGTVTHVDLYSGSRISAIGVSTNKISFTFSQASSCYLRNVNLRGNPLA